MALIRQLMKERTVILADIEEDNVKGSPLYENDDSYLCSLCPLGLSFFPRRSFI